MTKPIDYVELVKRAKERQESQPKSARHFHLRQFGISEDDYDRMLQDQDGRCAICFKECSTGRNLAVDHCHETGQVRGLLCTRCNMGIGYFSDDPNVILQAARYLRVTRNAPSL